MGMAAVDWSAPYAALVAALAPFASLPRTPIGFTVGDGIRAKLDAVGTAYDAAYTALGDGSTAYTAAVAAWQEQVSEVWTQAVNACRWVERKQREGQVGRVLVPQAIVNAAGTPLLLTEYAPALPSLPEPTATTRAALVLVTGGGDEVLRVEARDDGAPGSRVYLVVGSASDGNAAHFKLTAYTGDGPARYAEVFDNLDASTGTPSLGSQDESLLINSLVHVGLGRPVNASATVLEGGAGGAYEALVKRASDLGFLVGVDAALEVITAVDLAVLNEAVAQLERAWSLAPARRNPVAQREAELRVAIAEAEAITDFLNSGLA